MQNRHDNDIAAFWNSRYQAEIFAYGTEPNVFFKENIESLPAGKLLLPGEGEGRNAVFAASLGWHVSAFDISEEGQKKALKWASEHQVEVDYRVADWHHVSYPEESFDAVAMIFVHVHASQRFLLHDRMQKFLKPGGTLILEAFSKNHLAYNQVNKKAGGPGDPEMLYAMDDILSDFASFEVTRAEEKTISLKEGAFHQGPSSVVRFVGRKKESLFV